MLPQLHDICTCMTLALSILELVIVDTTAAPALCILCQQYSCSLCSSLKYTDS